MKARGWSHVCLVTLDLERTRGFYEGVLGFAVVRSDTIDVEEGGRIRHLFFDTGGDQLLAFMEPRGIVGIPVEFDASLNRPLGMPPGFYHFAFEAGSPEELAARRAALIEKRVRVTPIVDHGWAQSIYFEDPNGLLLEFACATCDVHADDFARESRFTVRMAGPSPFTDFRTE